MFRHGILRSGNRRCITILNMDKLRSIVAQNHSQEETKLLAEALRMEHISSNYLCYYLMIREDENKQAIHYIQLQNEIGMQTQKCHISSLPHRHDSLAELIQQYNFLEQLIQQTRS